MEVAHETPRLDQRIAESSLHPHRIPVGGLALGTDGKISPATTPTAMA